uniref:Rho-GAP domain-containing protein n=1 Tax=Romanomermis culicivorax TaxID=13658 RepID=A0A915J756_ROMCU
MANIPASYKPILHYLKIAQEHRQRDASIYYWCAYYGLQCAMKIDKKSPDCVKFLTNTLGELETMKKQHKDDEMLTSEIVAQAHIEEYALKLFSYADNEDRGGNFNKNVVKAFYTSGYLFDVLSVFGELDPKIVEARKYAKFKAAYIHNCLKNGETPQCGPIANDGSGAGPDINAEAGTSNLPGIESIAKPANPNIGVTVTETPSVAVTDYSSSKLDVYIKAQKFCKQACTALDYEDEKTAIENLTNALNLLTHVRIFFMDTSPDREAPIHYQNKFSKSSFSSHSDVSLDGKEDKRDRKAAKGSKKDQQGYCHLERASSEEELVDGQFRSKPKKSNVFGKLKSKSKTVSLDEKVPTSSKNSASSGKHSTTKHVKNSKVGSDTPSSPNKDGRGTGNRPVFGLPLRHALKNNPCHDRILIPAVFRMCIDYINENGLKVEGIYRLSPSKSQLEELKQVIDSGILSLQYDVLLLKDPLCAAALLKTFLRELPDDLLTTDLHAEFEQAVEKSKTSEECIERVKGLLNHLPESNRILLAYLFCHMKMIIDNAEYNKMTLANIGLVLQPALNWKQSLLNVFLQHSVNLFSDVKIRSYWDVAALFNAMFFCAMMGIN